MSQRSQLRAWSLVKGDDETAAQEGVNLDKHLVVLAAFGAGAVVDEEDVVLIVIKLGTLTEVDRVLEGERMKAEKLVILRGTYRKSDGSIGTHWLLGTLYTKHADGSVSTVVANDPLTGEQIEIDPLTKKVLSPNFPLAKFKVNGYQAVTLN